MVPLQYKEPDTLPVLAQAVPATAPPPDATQIPAEQVKPPALPVPTQAVPMAGVIHVVPLQ
jgi:hypothetical protein